MAKGDGAEGPPFTNTQGEQAEGRGFCTTKAEDDARVLPFSGSLLSPLTPAHKEQAERSSPSCRGGSSQLTENGPDEAELIPEAKRRCVSVQDLTLCSPSPPGETHTSGLAPGSEPPSSSSPFCGARPPAHCRVPSTGGNRASDLTTADGELEAAIVASVLELSKLQHDSLVGHRRQLETQLADKLTRRGLRIATVQADGNCMFRAVALLLLGDEELHSIVRTDAVSEVRGFPASYAPFETDIRAWALRMHDNSEWGDAIALQAIAASYNVSIEVVTSVPGQPSLLIHAGRPDARPCHPRRIVMAHIAHLHYDAFFPSDRPGGGHAFSL